MKKVPAALPERLKEQGLSIIAAWAEDVPEEYVSQVIEKSRQPHVMKFEGHEDAGGRFKDLAAYKQWSQKNKRLVYLLVADKENAPGEVGGIIWFGSRKNDLVDDKYSLTFGIRLYEGCVGKGLAKPFMQITHADLGRFYPASQSIWLDFVKENIAAAKAYSSFGYVQLTEADGRVVMGYDRD